MNECTELKLKYKVHCRHLRYLNVSTMVDIFQQSKECPTSMKSTSLMFDWTEDVKSLSETKCIHEHFMFCLIYHWYTLYCCFYLQCHISFHVTSSHVAHCFVTCQRSLTYIVQVSLISKIFWNSLCVNQHFLLQMIYQAVGQTLHYHVCCHCMYNINTLQSVQQISSIPQFMTVTLHSTLQWRSSMFRYTRWLYDQNCLYILSINKLIGKCNVNSADEIKWGR